MKPHSRVCKSETTFSSDSITRTEEALIPRFVLREAVVNAVMHRDYRQHTSVQIIRYTDRIEIRNAGRSLKTFARESDSVLLLDNDAWKTSGESLEEGFDKIKDRIAERIGLLLAAGEVIDGVGESVVDSSEIINTLKGGGVASLGYASAKAAEDAEENINVITSATRKALMTGTSLPQAVEADKALLIVAGHPDRIARKGVERARKWLEEETGSLEVRGGDFPLNSERIATLILLGGVEDSQRISEFMDRAREAEEQRQQSGGEEAAAAFENDDLDDLF